jgi:cytochrome c
MRFLTGVFLIAVLSACGSGASEGGERQMPAKQVVKDDGKGIGEITTVTLNDPLNADMITRGKGIYEMKCSACHKLTDQRVVGPGWSGLTAKRKPEWIMNMITNVEVMLEKDPEARLLLEECLTRMPNQNLSIGDSRDVLEFMYANDSKVAAQ